MMFPGARSCLNPCLVCWVSRPDQPLSSYHIDALASRLSPDTKDICHDNSTTVTVPAPLLESSSSHKSVPVTTRPISEEANDDDHVTSDQVTSEPRR